MTVGFLWKINPPKGEQSIPMLDHFGWIAPFYDRAIRLTDADRLIRLVNPPTDGRLLDAAGGTGRVAVALLPYLKLTVVLDESLKMLAEARSKKGLQLSAGRTEHLPFASGSFDRIIMIDALHHVKDQAGTVRELWRMLRPGGRLVIQELDLNRGMVKLIAMFEKLALMRSHFLSYDAITSLIAEAALVDKKGNPPPQIHIEREGHIIWIISDKQ